MEFYVHLYLFLCILLLAIINVGRYTLIFLICKYTSLIFFYFLLCMFALKMLLIHFIKK